jgi:riboflavin synthase
MFTGIIIELGEIRSLIKRGHNAELLLMCKKIIKDVNVGDSIAVNGVCLTVTKINPSGSELAFDVSFETLKLTNLGTLRRGDRVNLEPSLSLSSKIGGHFVTGHVDGVGKIRQKEEIENTLKIEIQAPEGVLSFLVEKGSVAVDGISLTVVNVLKDAFSVVIIPHTAKMTTLGFKGIGDTVNLEPDILGKYVAKFLNKTESYKSNDEKILSLLEKSGFV